MPERRRAAWEAREGSQRGEAMERHGRIGRYTDGSSGEWGESEDWGESNIERRAAGQSGHSGGAARNRAQHYVERWAGQRTPHHVPRWAEQVVVPQAEPAGRNIPVPRVRSRPYP